MSVWSESTTRLIRAALDEDLGGAGDISAGLIDAPDLAIVARVVPRQSGIICGLELGPAIAADFADRLEAALEFTPASSDGDPVSPGRTVATLRGPRSAVLSTERTLLNFLTRMSGVATLTRRYVDAARRGNPGVLILDTRKTLPGWRELDKYAVRCGGGTNHRRGLFDAILIKDNHIAGVPTPRLAQTLFEMLNRAAAQNLRPAFVEVEVDSLEQLREVLKVVGVDYVLLDNFSPDELREAVRIRDGAGLRGRMALEASGGVTLDSIGEIAATGVERISVGAITHSAAALDIGLDLD